VIKAVFVHNNSNRVSGFEITGHADSGPYGMDIVCAAVSALSIATVNGLTRVAKIEPKVESDDENGGLLKVQIPVDSDSQKNLVANALAQSLEDGLSDVALNYKSFMKLEITEK